MFYKCFNIVCILTAWRVLVMSSQGSCWTCCSMNKVQSLSYSIVIDVACSSANVALFCKNIARIFGCFENWGPKRYWNVYRARGTWIPSFGLSKSWLILPAKRRPATYMVVFIRCGRAYRYSTYHALVTPEDRNGQDYKISKIGRYTIPLRTGCCDA